MKVGDFQKCLRALAELISTKTPAKELVEAADALTPFADRTMEQFAVFLKLAETKYRETGQLPDGKPAPAPKPPKEPKARTVKVPKSPAPTTEELLAEVATLKVRLRTDQSLTKAGVEAALKHFADLKKPELDAAVKRLGMRSKPSSKGEALKMIVNHTIEAQGGIDRSDA
jgi:hypothetical protein